MTSPSRSTVWTTPSTRLAAVLHEPLEVRRELLERLDPLDLQPLDGEERDQPDQRADAELWKRPSG